MYKKNAKNINKASELRRKPKSIDLFLKGEIRENFLLRKMK